MSSSSKRVLANRLVSIVAAGGAAVGWAGCGGDPATETPATKAETKTEAHPTDGLPPLPEPDATWKAWGCSRSIPVGQLAGKCCTDVACYAPMPSDTACLPYAEAVAQRGLGLQKGAGSGTCACGSNGGIGGPYAVPDGYPQTPGVQPGSCCYTSTYNSCTGRPLAVAGTLRVASLAAEGEAWA